MRNPVMKISPLHNNNGIALVTSLLLTLISLTMVMALMYIIQMSVQTSGASKRYRSAVDAAYGGAQIITKEVFPLVMQNLTNTDITNSFQNINFTLLAGNQACFQSKLTQPTSHWLVSCD